MSVLTTPPAVLSHTTDRLEIGDAVLLNTIGHFQHSLLPFFVIPALMFTNPNLKGRDQCAGRIVSRRVGITMLKMQDLNQSPEPNLLIVTRAPVHLLSSKDLRVNVSNNSAKRVHIKAYSFVFEIVLIMADVVAQDNKRMVSSQPWNILDRLHEEIAHNLAGFGETDEAPLSKSVAEYTTRVWILVGKM